MRSTWARTVAISKVALLLLIASPAAEPNSATKLLELASARFGELSSAEENLFSAVANGDAKDYSDPLGKNNDPATADKWTSDRVLRASRIVWLCTDPRAASLVTHHGLRVKGARIEERIDIEFARLSFPLRFLTCAFEDSFSLTGAHLLILDLSGSYLQGLQANWAQIESIISLNNGFKNRGEASLIGATIGGDLDCSGGRFINGGGNALSCDGAKITGNVLLRDGFRAEGQVRLVGATIGGNLDCGDSILINRDSKAPALDASGAKIDGDVFLRYGFKCKGPLALIAAAIGGNLECQGGQFVSDGDALNANGAKIGGSVFFRDGIVSEGNMIFTYAYIARRFEWRGVTSPEKVMLLDLRFTKVGTLWNDQCSWPSFGRLRVDGFVYDQIREEAHPEAKVQIRWLQRQNQKRFLPQPFEQLAAVLRKMGDDEGAKKVMITENEDQAKHIPFRFNRIGDCFWFKIVGPIIGYGYRPWNAFIISLIVIGIGWWLFRLGYHRGLVTPTGQAKYTFEKDQAHPISYDYPKFNAFFYSVETFVPLVKLGIGEHWMPNANRGAILNLRAIRLTTGSLLRCYLWLHIIFGWVFTTLWVGGLTGLVKT